jgi:hypothetical protein
MLRSAIKLGFFGAIAYVFGRAFYSLFSLLVTVLGLGVLFGCLLFWVIAASAGGFL